jgi:predicted nucleotidyltransferase
MTNHKFACYLAHEQYVASQRGLQLERHKEQLTKHAVELVELLSTLGAQRVWVFGSVARGQARLTSDLDMAVEGLSYAQDELLGIAEQIIPPGISVDLIPWEKAHPELRAHILSEGRLMYDRKSRAGS